MTENIRETPGQQTSAPPPHEEDDLVLISAQQHYLFCTKTWTHISMIPFVPGKIG